MHPEFGINYQGLDFGIDQSASPSTKQQNDETLEDIKAIADLEPSGNIVHKAVLFPFQNCINFMLFDGVLLLGRRPLVQKMPIYRQISKSIKVHFSKQIANCFSFFLFCLAKNVQCSFLIYAFDIKLLIHK